VEDEARWQAREAEEARQQAERARAEAERIKEATRQACIASGRNVVNCW